VTLPGPGEPSGDLRHDLRTPLHAISGNVEILLRLETGRLSPEGRRSLGEISTALRMLEAAVARLLRRVDKMHGPGDAHTPG